MKKIIFSGIVIMTTLLSCIKLELGRDVTIRPEETYYIDYSTFFRIDSLRDYRCPIDVECFWSGDVDIFIKATEGSSTSNILAQLYSTAHNPVDIGNYSLKIVDVLPHLKSSDKPDPNFSRVIIRIERN